MIVVSDTDVCKKYSQKIVDNRLILSIFKIYYFDQNVFNKKERKQEKEFIYRKVPNKNFLTFKLI